MLQHYNSLGIEWIREKGEGGGGLSTINVLHLHLDAMLNQPISSYNKLPKKCWWNSDIKNMWCHRKKDYLRKMMMRCSQSRLKEPYSSNNVRENIVKTKKKYPLPNFKDAWEQRKYGWSAEWWRAGSDCKVGIG